MTIYPYGLCVAGAAAVSLLLAAFLMKKTTLRPGTLSWFALLAVPLCFLGARLGYCLCTLDWFLYVGLEFFFSFTEGGYILYGALLGGVAALGLTALITRQSAGCLADALAAPAAVMIALCRLAEPLANEGFGWGMAYWFRKGAGMSMFALEDPSFFLRFPFGVQNAWGEWHWAVFLLEAVIALVICAVLLRMKPAADGGKAWLFLLMYAAMQALCESMRQDSVLTWGFVRCSQVISAVAVGLVLAMCAIRLKRFLPLAWAGILACMGVVMAMEFALEKKIQFLFWMPMDLCYLVMAAACLGMIFIVKPLWRKAFAPALAQAA